MLLQAYTVELEAELNQLKDENAQLKLALVRIEMCGNSNGLSFQSDMHLIHGTDDSLLTG